MLVAVRGISRAVHPVLKRWALQAGNLRCAGVLLALLSVCAGALLAGEPGAPPAGEASKTADGKKEKPKIPPFKVSAWCVFRDYLGAQKQAQSIEPEKNEETRPESRFWGGFGRRGQWVRLVVELQNTTEKDLYVGNMRIRLDPSEEGTESGQKPYTTTYRQDFELPPGPPKQFTFSVLCPEFIFGQIDIDITANGMPFRRGVSLYDLDRSAQKGEDLVVVVSEDAGAFKHLLPQRRYTGDDLPAEYADPSAMGVRGRQVAVVQPSELPDAWHDLTVASLILLDGPPREAFSDAQLTALETYCQAGGQILISSGNDPARLKPAEGQTQSLADLAGLKVLQAGKLPNIDLFPGFNPTTEGWSLPIVEVAPRATLGEVTVWRNKATGLVEQSMRPVGLGAVHFVAFSLRDELLRNWQGRNDIPVAILQSAKRRAMFLYEDVDYSNMAQQTEDWNWNGEAKSSVQRQSLPWLRQELDRSFTSDTPVATQPPGMVASFLLLYLLAAVPLNYLLFGWLKRREAAWLAVPGWAVLFSIGAYYVGYAGQQGKLTVDEVSIVEAGPQQASAVARTFLNVYAPARDSYDLKFSGEGLPLQVIQGAPGHLISPEFGTRGITDVLPELDLIESPDGMLVNDLLIQSRSTRRLEVNHRVPLGEGIDARIKVDEKTRQYEVKIQNNTPLVLLDAALLMRLDDARQWAVPLGHLSPGEAEPKVLRLPMSKGGAVEAGTPAWDDIHQVFFGKPPTFRSARGQWAQERAQNVSAYISSRIQRAGDAVLVAWADGGMLPVSVGDDSPRDKRGFSLVVIPVPIDTGKAPVRGGFRIQVSQDAEIDAQTQNWGALNAGDGARLSMQTREDAALQYRIDPPEDVTKLSQPELEIAFFLYAESRDDASQGLPLGQRPRTVPSRYDGTPIVEVMERQQDGRTRWKRLAPPLKAFGIGVSERTATYRCAIPLSRGMLGTDNRVQVRIAVPKLRVTGAMDNTWNSWTLRVESFTPAIKEKGR